MVATQISAPSAAQPVSNPLMAGLRLERTAEPLAMVIFGASGDLAHRKLMPALYSLASSHLLPPHFAVVGVARRDKDHEDYRQDMKEAIQRFAAGSVQPEVLESFVNSLFFVPGEFQDRDTYSAIKKQLDQVSQERGTCGNVLYYLATPPEWDAGIVEQLGERGLITPQGNTAPWTRVIFEKPFGHDLQSAKDLNEAIHRYLREDQIYRIDHYLGKETVQNVMVVRFANSILEPVWNRNYVDNIQITAAESLGVEQRAGYYESAGALRDMIQSHLLQVFSLVAMEPPVAWTPKAIHDEKVKVLQATDHIQDDAVLKLTVRGQYGPGWVDGESVVGYRQEPGVAPTSTTDTFAAVKLHVDNWRWAGVPIYLRTGKRLPRRATEIALTFKRTPKMLFQELNGQAVEEDVLTMRIQPDEGVTLKLNAKVPGQGFQIQPVHLDFLYGTTFTGQVPEAYERLLLDAMLGDSTLFTRTDEVEEAWSIVQGILDVWAEAKPDFPNYAAGSWGPDAADALVAEDGHRWRNP